KFPPPAGEQVLVVKTGAALFHWHPFDVAVRNHPARTRLIPRVGQGRCGGFARFRPLTAAGRTPRLAKELHLRASVPMIFRNNVVPFLTPSRPAGRRGKRFMTQVRTTFFPEPRAAGAEDDRARADLTGCPWHDVKSM